MKHSSNPKCTAATIARPNRARHSDRAVTGCFALGSSARGALGAIAFVFLAGAVLGEPPCNLAVRPMDRDPVTGQPVPHVQSVFMPAFQEFRPFEVTRNLVPVLENQPNATGVRPHDVSLFDPARARSEIIPDPSLPPVSGSTSPTYRWATFRIIQDGSGNEVEVEGEPYPSACYHSLLFRPDWPNVFRPSDFRPAQLDWSLGYLDGFQGYGFRANASLENPLSIGNFLPPAPTLGESSLALMPASISSRATGWQGLTRPTVEGVVDLVSGLPLVKVTDLELPFAGATFRLNRTRAAGPVLAESLNHGRGHGNASDRWWDWTGVGWMIGENPVLLIDSAIPDIVGDNPRTTRLVLDAHTSIPFQLIETTGEYEAPPRFRARLRHNGDWNVSTHWWATPPTQYEVSLYEGEITYTFVAVREDVPANKWWAPYVGSGSEGVDPEQVANTLSSSHDRPLLPQHFASVFGSQPPDSRELHDPWWWPVNPGAGIPYLGLCKEIRDRHGRRVVMDYQSAKRRHMDDPATPDVIECQQDGLAKGQLRSIKLISKNAAGQDEVKWTLLYAHRRFPGVNWVGHDAWFPDPEYDPARFDIITQLCPEEDPARYELHGDVAIDRIYAYEGDVSDAMIKQADLTLHHTDRPGFTSEYSEPDAHDPLTIYNAAHPSATLPTNWRHQVRYHYSTIDEIIDWSTCYQYGTRDLAETYAWFFGMAPGAVASVPTLAMTSVHTRTDSTATGAPTGPVSTTLRGYVYESVPLHQAYWPQRPDMPWLRMILEDRGLRDLAAATTNVVVQGSSDRVAALLQQIAANDPTVGDIGAFAILNFSRAQFGIDAEPTLGILRQANYANWASEAELDEHLTWEPDQLVKTLTVQDGSGAARHYRFRRFVNPADAMAGSSQTPTSQPSMWFVPYSWRGYTEYSTGHGEGAIAFPDLQKPRYIVVIDEVPDRAMLDSGYYDQSTSLLRDYRPDGTVRTCL